jgi:hypothetical protein
VGLAHSENVGWTYNQEIASVYARESKPNAFQMSMNRHIVEIVPATTGAIVVVNL